MTPGASDATLLAAARGGSLGAFGVLYDRYRLYAVDTARTALPKADARYAEDVAEAAFASVLNAVRNGRHHHHGLNHYARATGQSLGHLTAIVSGRQPATIADITHNAIHLNITPPATLGLEAFPPPPTDDQHW